ncbi:hypothetical protein FIBSPDRAFT_895537 [Athelia psychrophila]|uniref:Uncharacterized protein n=1 Tax=Athelia psychrophila TaxID=1759441 RepID=A0A166EEU4_9AGAM|nr:hypothetical protein FIBSPDRAFT_895537 [Fibularhizoctonia sp. CBS 109695]
MASIPINTWTPNVNIAVGDKAKYSDKGVYRAIKAHTSNIDKAPNDPNSIYWELRSVAAQCCSLSRLPEGLPMSQPIQHIKNIRKAFPAQKEATSMSPQRGRPFVSRSSPLHFSDADGKEKLCQVSWVAESAVILEGRWEQGDVALRERPPSPAFSARCATAQESNVAIGRCFQTLREIPGTSVLADCRATRPVTCSRGRSIKQEAARFVMGLGFCQDGRR